MPQATCYQLQAGFFPYTVQFSKTIFCRLLPTLKYNIMFVLTCQYFFKFIFVGYFFT